MATKFPHGSSRWLRFLLISFFVLVSLWLIRLISHHVSPKLLPLEELKPTLERGSYQRETPSFFPPTRGQTTDFCAGFPSQILDDVQVVIKTGVGEADRAAANLDTTSSCLQNAIVVSDVSQQIGKHRTIDIIADLPDTYQIDDPDFDTYRKQKEAFEKDGSVEYSNDGWKLDRFKFLPMVDRAYNMRPNAKWYVFTEADVYIFWDSMLRVLHQYNPDTPLYLGAPVHGSYGRDFGYGGASFVISHGLMKELNRTDDRSLAAQFELWAKDDCCGDAVIAYAIKHRTNVRLTGLRPMFAGDDPATLMVDGESWCTPLVSLHRVQPKEMHRLWQWERTRPYSEKPLVFSEFLQYTHPYLRNATIREDWDNVSDLKQPDSSKSHQSFRQCADACRDDKECLQFSYIKSQCRLGHYLMKGHPVNKKEGEFRSGWDMDKIAAMGFDPDMGIYPTCKKIEWSKPQLTPTDP